MENEVLIYLLKVSAGIGIVSLSNLLLRTDTGLVIKRYYLLSGLVAAWIVPLIRFPQILLPLSHEPVVYSTPEVSINAAGITGGMQSTAASGFNWALVLTIVYLTGFLVILARNMFLVWKWGLKAKSPATGDNIIFSGVNHVFTFISRIFIPEKYIDDNGIAPVIMHEKAHVRQKHFIDLIIMEMTVLFTWFNPFIWLMSRMIRENHEHLADREVLMQGVDPAQYRAQIINFSFGTNYLRLGSQFNNSITKTRFEMMKKRSTKSNTILKYSFIIPVIAFTLMVCTGSVVKDQDGTARGKVYFSDTGRPAHGASIVIKETSTGTVAGNNGDFVLEYEGDPVIVISYVGYKTLEIKASKITDKPIRLELTSYELDLSSVDARKPEGIRIMATSGSNEEDPVILVDGKRIEDLNGVNPDDIQSVEVIKEQSNELVKKYDAKGGLIIIHMKDSKEHKSDEVFVVVEDMPKFPGGLPALKAYIYENLVYPEEAKDKGIGGKVTVEFTVNTEGKVEDLSIYKSTDKLFEDPVLDVFRNMPLWKPGMQSGKEVKVRLQVPVELKPEK